VEITALPHPEYLAKNGQWATDLAQVSPWRAPLALITVPDSSSYKTRVTETLTLQELTRVAFALRRFKTAKGAYPDALCALEPEFLPEAPVDQFTCKPLLYRKEGDGCVFYSVGKGQDDEGGTGDDCVWKLTR
jgi:hypothetical protein